MYTHKYSKWQKIHKEHINVSQNRGESLKFVNAIPLFCIYSFQHWYICY